MKKKESSQAALRRFSERMQECNGDFSVLLQKLQRALAEPDEVHEPETTRWIEDFDAMVAEAVRLRQGGPMRAPAAKPKSPREAEAEWKKLEAELEQELIKKFNL
jgi:hypothetical protein